MNNRVVYFEIPSDEPERLMNFFEKVFGWEYEQFADDYWSAFSGNEDTQGINGAIMKKRDQKHTVVNTISVDNIDEYVKKIESNGGKIVIPKFPVPSIGWVLYFTDPDGNLHGIWHEDRDLK
ncbi:MAG: VOC family protein [Ignavibacteria bacterium]